MARLQITNLVPCYNIAWVTCIDNLKTNTPKNLLKKIFGKPIFFYRVKYSNVSEYLILIISKLKINFKKIQQKNGFVSLIAMLKNSNSSNNV